MNKVSKTLVQLEFVNLHIQTITNFIQVRACCEWNIFYITFIH